MLCLSIRLNLRNPSASLRMFKHAFVAASVVSTRCNILFVLRAIDLAQVDKSVISRVSIYMVYFEGWKLAVRP